MRKTINFLFVFIGLFLLIGCTSSEPTLPDTPSFKQGQMDGCATATGDYVKNNDAFEMDRDYHNGWFYGRKTCNPAHANS